MSELTPFSSEFNLHIFRAQGKDELVTPLFTQYCILSHKMLATTKYEFPVKFLLGSMVQFMHFSPVNS